jgi:hypothetical protein
MQDLLTNPGHPIALSLWLEHVAVGGLLAATISLLAAIALRSRAGQVCALCALILISGTSWIHRAAVQRAYPMLRTSPNASTDWIDVHMDRVERYAPAQAALGFVGVLALLIPMRHPLASTPLAAITLALAIACAVLALHTADASHAIRNAELRPVPTATEALPLDGL